MLCSVLCCLYHTLFNSRFLHLCFPSSHLSILPSFHPFSFFLSCCCRSASASIPHFAPACPHLQGMCMRMPNSEQKRHWLQEDSYYISKIVDIHELAYRTHIDPGYTWYALARPYKISDISHSTADKASAATPTIECSDVSLQEPMMSGMVAVIAPLKWVLNRSPVWVHLEETPSRTPPTGCLPPA